MTLDESVALLIRKLRARAKSDPEAAGDVLDVLFSAMEEDKNEPVEEITKTICEILEPERVGSLVRATCTICKTKLLTNTDQARGYCDRH